MAVDIENFPFLACFFWIIIIIMMFSLIFPLHSSHFIMFCGEFSDDECSMNICKWNDNWQYNARRKKWDIKRPHFICFWYYLCATTLYYRNARMNIVIAFGYSFRVIHTVKDVLLCSLYEDAPLANIMNSSLLSIMLLYCDRIQRNSIQ